MKVILVVLLATIIAAQKIAPLLTVAEAIPGRYIVKLKEGQKIDDVIMNLTGAKITRKYSKVFNGFAADLSDSLVEWLRKSEAIEFIEQDGVARAYSVASWGLDRIDQLDLPLNNAYESDLDNGSGVNVYVLDTGINLNHSDWEGRASYGRDTIDEDFDSEDCNGHGSHCTGTLGGTQYGVAKAVNLIGVRVLNCNGIAPFSVIIEGCEWVIGDVTKHSQSPAIASMSIGGDISRSFNDAVIAMIDANITVVVAAGNENDYACSYSPGGILQAITVGATDVNDARASFSNYGYCVDIFAPGDDITSAWYGAPNASETISGTSMACPHVAGAAAALLGTNPNLTPSEVKETLQLKAMVDKVSDAKDGSPNLLLYVGKGSGGGYIHAGCNQVLNSPSGTITSPYYPNFYTDNMNCEYLVTTTNEKEVISLSFDIFDIESHDECSYDSLTVYDGASMDDPLLKILCGNTIPDVFMSTGKSLLLVFRSDNSVQKKGFSASYQALEIGVCGRTISSATSLLTSPNYPVSYGNNVDCSFTILAQVGQTITLTFTDVDIEDHLSCSSDAVEVHDGGMYGPYLAKVCGKTIPPPITSTKDSMFVRFISDNSITRSGFKALTTTQ